MGETMVRAARGAIRVERDAAETVLTATERLLRELLASNGIEGDDIVSAFFTVTDDLRSAFPAVAARRIGLGRAPLLCAQEIPVEGSMRGVDPRAPPVPYDAAAVRRGPRVPGRRGVAAR